MGIGLFLGGVISDYVFIGFEGVCYFIMFMMCIFGLLGVGLFWWGCKYYVESLLCVEVEYY